MAELRATISSMTQQQEESMSTSTITDPREDFRDELAALPGQWYIAHAYTGRERAVMANMLKRVETFGLEDVVFEVRVPMEAVTAIKGGVRKQVIQPKLPGYILVRMDLTPEAHGAVHHTPGVTGFLGTDAQHPTPLDLDDVVEMLWVPPVARVGAAPAGSLAALPARAVVESEFSVGDPVMVVTGAFASLPATVSMINPTTGRVTCMIEIFGRETPVELGTDQIQAI